MQLPDLTDVIPISTGRIRHFRFLFHGRPVQANIMETESASLLALRIQVLPLPFTAESAWLRRMLLDSVLDERKWLSTDGRYIHAHTSLTLRPAVTPIELVASVISTLVELWPRVEARIEAWDRAC